MRDRGCETAVVGGSAAGVVDVTPFPRGCRRSSSGTFVGSETLRCWALWGWLGSIGSEHGLGGELGGSLDVDDVVGDVVDVWDAHGGETTRLRSHWGELGCIGSERGCSAVSSGLYCRFWAVARVPERGRAGNTANVDVRVDDDVAIALGHSRCVMGSRGTGWGEQRGMGGDTGRRWG
jgi:hypothetical protein